MSWLEHLPPSVQTDKGVIDRYSRGLLAIARRQLPDKVRNRVDPEDVVQSVYRSFFRRLNNGEFQFDDSHDVWKLLAIITYHKTQNVIKHHRRQQRDAYRDVTLAGGVEAGGTELHGREPGPEDVVAMLDTLEGMLRGLPEEYRDIVVLRLEGHSLDDIARRVALSRRTVLRALAKLRDVASQQIQSE